MTTGRPRSAHDAVAVIARLPALRLVSVDRRLARLAADHSLRGADAIYVALASVLSLPLVTLDQEQLTRAASIITAQQS